MTTQEILLPLFVEVILTFLLMGRHGGVAHARFRQPAPCGPRRSHCASRSGRRGPCSSAIAFSNQFEIPVLFYVLTILAYVTHLAGLIFVILAWIFVDLPAPACLCARDEQ